MKRSHIAHPATVLGAVLSGLLGMHGGGALATTSDVVEPTFSCQGVPATVVGEQNKTVEGTSGRDVIVSNGASPIEAGDGDDLICVTGDFEHQGFPALAGVDGGRGDDVVDTSAQAASRPGVAIYWTPGADTVSGGPAADFVNLCGDVDFGNPGGVDEAPDEVATGGGDDRVYVCAQGGRDQVDLGEGDDETWVEDPADYLGHVDGGPGWNSLRIHESNEAATDTAWNIDMASGTARASGAVTASFSWERFGRVVIPRLSGRLDVSGSPGADTVTVGQSLGAARTLIHATLGLGNDRFNVQNTDLAPGSVIDLGEGTNSLVSVSPPARDVSLDLDEGELRIQSARRSDSRPRALGQAAIRGVHAARVAARKVRLDGTAADETLHANGCQVRVEGRDGNDIVVLGLLRTLVWDLCANLSPSHHADGGEGDDELRGYRGDDILIGGEGRDHASARRGFDTCDAEVAHDCELTKGVGKDD